VKFFGKKYVLLFFNSCVQILNLRSAKEAKDERGKKKCK